MSSTEKTKAVKFKDPVRSKIVINVRHYKRSYIFSTRDGRLSCERDHGVRNKINKFQASGRIFKKKHEGTPKSIAQSYSDYSIVLRFGGRNVSAITTREILA